MNKLLLALVFIGVSANAQFNQTREQYADNVGNYRPGIQASFLTDGSRTFEVGVSYTDILTFGGSIERTQSNVTNNQEPFYGVFGSIGGEFERVTITVKGGVTNLQQMGATERTTHIVFGGSFEYRILPNIGLIIGSDSLCDRLLLGVAYHFGEK